MNRRIPGIGEFTFRGDYWECLAAEISGLPITIDNPDIESQTDALTALLKFYKDSILSECIAYIESQRRNYGLSAKEFGNPNIVVMNTVTVFFDTELETEATVGVEFLGTDPLQLIIGD